MRRPQALLAVAALVVVATLVLPGAGGATTSAIKDRAEHAAHDALAGFRVPPHGRSIARPPAGTNPNVLVPIPLGHGFFGSPYLVARHRFFVVPGTAEGVGHWLAAHPAAGWSGFILDGRCRATTVGSRCLLVYGHADAGEFKGLDPQLLVKVIQDRGRRSVVRVDTDLAWLGPKTRFDVVPTGATVLTVSPAIGAPAAGHVRVIRSAAAIAAFRHLVNSLQVPGPNEACTSNLVGPPWLYSFKRSATSAPLAEVYVNLSGCGTVDVEVHGHPGAELTGSAPLFGHLP